MAAAAESADFPDAEKNLYDRDSADGHIEQLNNVATYYSSPDIDALSKEHKEYLLQRHGTLELDPLPGHGDADPYNWSTTKASLVSTFLTTTSDNSRKQSTYFWWPFTP